MSNHLSALLNAWTLDKDATDWVLVTVFKTEGSAYRKSGAMMLFNDFGQQFGMLSGGCLETVIMRHARNVMHTGKVKLLTFDGRDEDDWSFQLNIGCGGKVYIMLQPLSVDNDLGLGAMADSLAHRQAGVYWQKIGAAEARFEASDTAALPRSVIETSNDGDWLVTRISPEPHLLVIGGGIDARPLVAIAGELGWHVTLADPRASHARTEHFPKVETVLRDLGVNLTRYIDNENVDAAVIMSHNVDLDADGLLACQGTSLGYVALLGPRRRYRQVVERAGLDETRLTCPVSAPAGLDIGGQLPESIALSIVAECHAVLHQSKSLPALRLAAT